MTAGRTDHASPVETPEPPGGADARQNSVAEAEVARRLAEARDRLERRAHVGTPRPTHYRREAERPFTAEERDRVTILIGGLTGRHEDLIQGDSRGVRPPVRAGSAGGSSRPV